MHAMSRACLVSFGLPDRRRVLPGRNASRMGRTTVRMPNFYPGGFRRRCAGSVPQSRLLRAQRSGGGTLLRGGVFQPCPWSPLTTRPSAGRVRPDWNSAVSGSGEPGACRHETGLTEPPESDEQLAGERYDHHTTDSSPASRGSVFEPFAKRTVWLMAQPAPRHLNELSPDPGWTVTADPLVALRVPARPRGWRYANPTRELPAVAEAGHCLLPPQRGRWAAGAIRPS